MVAWWKSMSAKARGLFLVTIVVLLAILIVVPFPTCEEEAQASIEDLFAQRSLARAELREKRQKEREVLLAKADRERDEREKQWKKQRQLMGELTKPPPPKKRRIRRFQWESPAATRGRLWNIPEEESEEATLTAFLRVCMAESGGHTQDCVGIWQVVKNNRSRSCDRKRVSRITECIEGEGETYLSALRRHQRHALGFIKARNKRAIWIRNLTIDCEDPPEGFHGTLDQWDAMYQQRCSQIVSDGRYLIKGELPPARPGHRAKWLKGYPLTWGGRCESKSASCDDRIACERGLARIPETETLNAFWCRPGARGCRVDPEPICLSLGYEYEQFESRGQKLWKPVVPTKHLSKRAKARLLGIKERHEKALGVDLEDEDEQNHTQREERSSESPSADLEGPPRDDVRGQEEHAGTGASS